MTGPFTFIDREITLRFFEEEPVEICLYLGDALEDRLQAAVAHYDQPHILEEDLENFRMLLGEENAAAILQRAGELDRLGVLELLSYTVRVCREEQGKKLLALAAAAPDQSGIPCGTCPMAS